MTNLTVREHLANDLLDLKHDFDHVFHRIFKHHAFSVESAETFFAVAPPFESWVDTEGKQFHLSVPVPGVKPEALNIILQSKQLTFSGELKQRKEKDYLGREVSYDRFVRTVTLPDGVDGEKLTAELKDGILEITAPIAAAALPKKIEVKKV